MSSAGAANPVFGIGGSAFLKPWFDAYRAEAPGGSSTLTAGDAVGATPPISAFFGDKPTIEFMNLDGLRLRRARQPQLRPRRGSIFRNELDPARRLRLPLVQHRRRQREDAGGVDEVEGRADSRGVQLRLVGFSNPGHPRADQARVARTLPRGRPARGGERRGGKRRGQRRTCRRSSPSATWARPPGRSRTRPARSSTLPTASAASTPSSATTRTSRWSPTRPNGVLAVENLSRGVRFTARPDLHRHAGGGGRLQDGRLPQALEHRRDAGSDHPGADRRAQCRPARRSWRRSIGSSNRCRAAVGLVRPCRRAALRVARSGTSSPTRCGRRTAPTSRSRTRAASAPT